MRQIDEELNLLKKVKKPIIVLIYIQKGVIKLITLKLPKENIWKLNEKPKKPERNENIKLIGYQNFLSTLGSI